MSRHRPILIAALGAGLLAAGLLTGCATGAASSPEDTAATVTPTPDAEASASSGEVEAAWLDAGRSIAIVTHGSSTCVPVVDGEPRVAGDALTVTLGESARTDCTRDMAPRATLVGLPSGVDPTRSLEVIVGGGGGGQRAGRPSRRWPPPRPTRRSSLPAPGGSTRARSRSSPTEARDARPPSSRSPQRGPTSPCSSPRRPPTRCARWTSRRASPSPMSAIRRRRATRRSSCRAAAWTRRIRSRSSARVERSPAGPHGVTTNSSPTSHSSTRQMADRVE
ncbi:hypothetical protein SAMN04487848_0830 [Microbacterium sp. ru370.1]|nr:hypothetical protein SAMN04487848_0830 [Microbacterium sp. ru370.1]